MKTSWTQRLSILALCAACAACAGFGTAPVHIGDTEAQVVASLGKPAQRYADGNQTTLIYPQGPFGQRTYVAKFDPSGKLVSYEQVLTTLKFGTIKIGQDTKQSVMKNFGPPAETSYLPRFKYEVWSYRYKESDVWNSMMHVHFDQDGVVRLLQNGPDPMYDERRLLR